MSTTSTEAQKNAERVAREDLLMFLNASFSCVGQREFYESAQLQSVSITFLHEYVLSNYRELYALMLASGINHFNQTLIIQNLLREGRGVEREARRREVSLILSSLKQMQVNRAIRALTKLVELKVNNRATRAVIRAYLESRERRAFETLKYKAKIKKLALHAHLKLPADYANLLFNKEASHFEEPLFTLYQRALYSKRAIYQLPFTIAEGLASKHKIDRKVFLKNIEPMMTEHEKRRLMRASDRAGHTLDVALHKTPLTALCVTLLALSKEERLKRLDEYEQALQRRVSYELSIKQAQLRSLGPLPRVALILDNSYSSRSSYMKKNRSLAVALALSLLLERASGSCASFWTSPPHETELNETAPNNTPPNNTPPNNTGQPLQESPQQNEHKRSLLLMTPQGTTRLAHTLLRALKSSPELVIIVSDGYENHPAGGVREVVRVFKERLDPQETTSFLHLNPTFDSDYLAPRPLSAQLPTMGIRDAEDIFTLLAFARFLSADTSEAALASYLSSLAEGLDER